VENPTSPIQSVSEKFEGPQQVSGPTRPPPPLFTESLGLNICGGLITAQIWPLPLQQQVCHVTMSLVTYFASRDAKLTGSQSYYCRAVPALATFYLYRVSLYLALPSFLRFLDRVAELNYVYLAS